MLPSLNAGTFEGGRPQIVFEGGFVIEPKLPRTAALRLCYNCFVRRKWGMNAQGIR